MVRGKKKCGTASTKPWGLLLGPVLTAHLHVPKPRGNYKVIAKSLIEIDSPNPSSEYHGKDDRTLRGEGYQIPKVSKQSHHMSLCVPCTYLIRKCILYISLGPPNSITILLSENALRQIPPLEEEKKKA